MERGKGAEGERRERGQMKEKDKPGKGGGQGRGEKVTAGYSIGRVHALPSRSLGVSGGLLGVSGKSASLKDSPNAARLHNLSQIDCM